MGTFSESSLLHLSWKEENTVRICPQATVSGQRAPRTQMTVCCEERPKRRKTLRSKIPHFLPSGVKNNRVLSWPVVQE